MHNELENLLAEELVDDDGLDVEISKSTVHPSTLIRSSTQNTQEEKISPIDIRPIPVITVRSQKINAVEKLVS